MDNERTTSLWFRLCSFYVMLLSDKYASLCLVMFARSAMQTFVLFCICPECVRLSFVLDPVVLLMCCSVMFVDHIVASELKDPI